MNFSRQFVVLRDHHVVAYFNTREDAWEHYDKLKKGHPYTTFGIFEKIDRPTETS
jgi:hypothetical protein